MSEYIEIETEVSENGRFITLYTNLRLTSETNEQYTTPDEMSEGSPLAQTLAVIEGITHLDIAEHTLTVGCDPDTPWHSVVAEISAALKDFFL